ncbi:hypothetical protein Srufu_016220 [Streptomyces libani subsp. rufus]|nr:hypothetical protein Srufu_016220 [Streptomyces libani subsp. rufus]
MGGRAGQQQGGHQQRRPDGAERQREVTGEGAVRRHPVGRLRYRRPDLGELRGARAVWAERGRRAVKGGHGEHLLLRPRAADR